jgi:hypothetical protein
LKGKALKKTVIFLFHAHQVALCTQKFYLYAIGDYFASTLVAIRVRQRSFAVCVVRPADIAQVAEPLVVADTLPTKRSESRLPVLAEVNLTKGTIKRHLTIATLCYWIVGEAVLAVVEQSSP